jgi:hypothetical protein
MVARRNAPIVLRQVKFGVVMLARVTATDAERRVFDLLLEGAAR